MKKKTNKSPEGQKMKIEYSSVIYAAFAIYSGYLLFTSPAGEVQLPEDSRGIIGQILLRFFYAMFGEGAVLFPFVLLAAAVILAFDLKKRSFSKGLAFLAAYLCLLGIFSLLTGTVFIAENSFYDVFAGGLGGFTGGIAGNVTAWIFFRLFGVVGGVFFISLTVLLLILFTFDVSPVQTVGMFKERLSNFKLSFPAKKENIKKQTGKKAVPAVKQHKNVPIVMASDHNVSEKAGIGKETAGVEAVKEKKAQKTTAEEKNPDKTAVDFRSPATETGTAAEYSIPEISVLGPVRKKASSLLTSDDINENIRTLQNTLESFGVRGQVVQVSCGPAITQFEFQPAPGVKVSRIVNLADDISLSLAASGVRIVAPIPGKAAIGIEVPNSEVNSVLLREILEMPVFREAVSPLSVALGKNISGEPVVADLSSMPHLLVAGATGSGKSVCMNSIITSVLFKASPIDVKMLMIDPKKVELTAYNGIPHLISPVVTDPKKAASSLRWAVQEMNRRYDLFASAGVRDMGKYNEFCSESANEGKGPDKLPYILVFIDELADLMMVAPHDVEDAICRLAQMARAAGIHLVIATQRPSVDVITGLIKANIPSRIAFAVSSQTDSRTILDMGGAEKLLGKGDMLYYPTGFPKPLRVQGVFISDREIENLVSEIKKAGGPQENANEVVFPETAETETGEDEMDDELVPKAAHLFIENGQASISLLQRRFRVGYTRAARIIDIMEQKGFIGKHEGSKPRQVLIKESDFERIFGEEF